MVIEDMQTIGDAALDTSAPFDEAAVLHEVIESARPPQHVPALIPRRSWT